MPIHETLIGLGEEFLRGRLGSIGQPGSTATTASLPPLVGSGCSPGFERNAAGQCQRSGIVGATQRFLPGGATGFQPEQFGAAVMGAFGAALEPAAMASTRLMCPRGTVLGRDNLCYNRRDLRKSERKWDPGTKPVLTGGQVNTLKKAQRIQERMKKLGLTGTAPHTHRRKTRKLLR